MKVIAWILGALLLLAGISYVTTARCWDGGYPPVELRVRILTTDGHPVAGVEVAVSSRGQPRYAYPIHEFTETSKPKSDNQGLVVLHQTWSGLQFGGSDWQLFWIFRMGYTGPKLECTFSHPDYTSRTFPFRELLFGKDWDWNRQRKKVVIDGRTNEMFILERTIEIQRTVSHMAKDIRR